MRYCYLVQIRPVGDDDIEAIVRFKCQLIDSYGNGFDTAEYPDLASRIEGRLRDLLARDTHRFLVATDDGRPVGCISAGLHLSLPGPTWAGVVADIGDMWVEPEFRTRGIGRALMSTILEWIRSRDATFVRLHATPGAVDVYRRLGFTPEDRSNSFFTAMVHDLRTDPPQS